MRVLAFAPHPDDAELHCGGTLAALARHGHTVGIVDCTRGEMGSRGSVSSRQEEITAANQALGIAAEHRFNLGLRDGFLLDHSQRPTSRPGGDLRSSSPTSSSASTCAPATPITTPSPKPRLRP